MLIWLLRVLSDIDECMGVNCNGHGQCKDLVDDYECECDKGFAGKNCHLGIPSIMHHLAGLLPFGVRFLINVYSVICVIPKYITMAILRQ